MCNSNAFELFVIKKKTVTENTKRVNRFMWATVKSYLSQYWAHRYSKIIIFLSSDALSESHQSCADHSGPFCLLSIYYCNMYAVLLLWTYWLLYACLSADLYRISFRPFISFRIQKQYIMKPWLVSEKNK